MTILLALILFNLIVLCIGIKTQKFLYTVTPEAQWKKALVEFNSNLEKFNKMGVSHPYQLGEHHLY